MNAAVQTPAPTNEPRQAYAPGSPERAALKARLGEMSAAPIEIPLVIGGAEVRSGDVGEAVCPHDHRHVLARYHRASARHVETAIAAAREAWRDWQATPWETRLAVFLKAAELLAGPWRATINAATMLGQSKSVSQAEIDAACELIDFWRFNPHFARQILGDQPRSARGVWNYVEQRPLEGFVLAVTPFNFTSIAGNLPTSPAMVGNVCLWKPASSAVYSAYHLMRLLVEAGLPPGVINFVPGSGAEVGGAALASEELAGIHFTGSTAVFQDMWRTVGENIARYRGYPRLVGETGGKDFVFAHASADVPALVTALVRGAFEYQGQKCSAASRAFLPASIWPAVRDGLLEALEEVTLGDPQDFSHFMNAVIDRGAFETIKGYVDFARGSRDGEILAGGRCDDAVGYFIEPTVVLTDNPDFKLIREEIFGPVLTIFVYPDGEIDRTLEICDRGSPYGLTGAVFARDRRAIDAISERLRYAAGNFYVNDKPTGAVVGQQPFGGGRLSGTNDKAGSMLNLLRWTSPRSVKETFVPPRDFRYPHMREP